MLGEFCKKNNLFLYVIACRLFMDPFDMEECGAEDIMITGSQNFWYVPGNSIIVLATKVDSKELSLLMYEAMYFDLKML